MKVPGIRIILFALGSLVVLTNCDKKNLEPVTQLKIRLTDVPVNAQEVNVHIKEVRVKFANDTTETTLNTKEAIYNLLDYQDGKDTVIAQGNLSATNTIREIRVILGDNNTLKINSEVYPLNIPVNLRGGTKIIVNKKLNKNIESVVLDFDAALSVVELGKGNYQLNPVIKLK
ncbi:MAG: DUF4382 domain-containing protein [Segetibacter sp.]|nr:DUF4382 domain-containing protein [Segetibacter sp.]